MTGVRSRSEILCLGVESDERRHPERDALGDTKGLQALGDFLIALPFRMATTRPLWMLSRTKPSSLWSSRLLSGKLDRRASATNWRMPDLPILSKLSKSQSAVRESTSSYPPSTRRLSALAGRTSMTGSLSAMRRESLKVA